MSDNPEVEETKVTKIYSQLELPTEFPADASINPEICPECGLEGTLMRTGHCVSCLFCGYSLCSL